MMATHKSLDAALTDRSSSRHALRVPVGELVDGSSVALWVHVLHGQSSGPTLYLGAAVHGDEVAGIEVIRQFFATVDVSRLQGTVIAVPVQNPFAFRARQRMLPMNVFDGYQGDAHTAFPGAADGEQSAFLADSLLGIIRRADAGIDLHAPLQGGEQVDYVFAPSRGVDPDGKALGLGKAFGVSLVIAQEAGGYVGATMLHEVATAEGVPTIGVEFSTGGRFSQESTAVGLQGVSNVLRALDMLPGDPLPPPRQVVTPNVVWARSTRGGLLDISVRPGDVVAEGQALGRIFGLDFSLVEEVRAGSAGLVYRTAVPRPVSAHDRIAGIAVADR